MFLSNKPGVPPGINLLQKPSQKLSRPSGNLASDFFPENPARIKIPLGLLQRGVYKDNSTIRHENKVRYFSADSIHCSKLTVFRERRSRKTLTFDDKFKYVFATREYGGISLAHFPVLAETYSVARHAQTNRKYLMNYK